MSRSSKTPPGQMELMEWQAPEPVARFQRDRVRSATLAGKLARAVSETLKGEVARGISRHDVALEMTEVLGEEVTENMLNAYASEAREGHVISVMRLIGLINVSLDRRLLQVIADEFGWVVIDKKFLPVIELASLREHQDALKKIEQSLRQKAREQGAL